MSCHCVSSTVTRNGMFPIDFKNSCFTERAFPLGVVDRDTQTVFGTNSKLIWFHMKPKSWIGEQTTKLQHVEQTMREVGRILSHKLDSCWGHELFYYQEHAGSSFAKGLNCPVVLYWSKILKNLADFWTFFESRSSEERTEQTYDALYLVLAST